MGYPGVFRRHFDGVARDEFGLVHGAAGAQDFLECLDLEDFLKYDDVGFDVVDLACGPFEFGVIEVFVVGVLVIVELEVWQGAVAQIECGDFECDAKLVVTVALVVVLWVHGDPLCVAVCALGASVLRGIG